MQAVPLFAVAFLLACSQLEAQQAAPQGSLLPVGTRVRVVFSFGTKRWYEGYVKNLTRWPEVCFIVFSDELRGGTTLQYVESLQVDRSGWRRVDGSSRDTGPRPQW